MGIDSGALTAIFPGRLRCLKEPDNLPLNSNVLRYTHIQMFAHMCKCLHTDTNTHIMHLEVWWLKQKFETCWTSSPWHKLQCRPHITEVFIFMRGGGVVMMLNTSFLFFFWVIWVTIIDNKTPNLNLVLAYFQVTFRSLSSLQCSYT